MKVSTKIEIVIFTVQILSCAVNYIVQCFEAYREMFYIYLPTKLSVMHIILYGNMFSYCLSTA